MGSLLERYGKGDDMSAAPSDAASVSLGLPCCAQFTEDRMWYRARVLKFVDQDKVEVMSLTSAYRNSQTRLSRQRDLLHLPSVRTEVVKRSFYYHGCKVFNNFSK